MATIESASSAAGPTILEIAAGIDIFTPTERDCVRELWEVYQNSGEASGYVFLVYRDDHG